MEDTQKKEFLFGAQEIADAVCNGNRRRAYWLVERGVIRVRRVGRLLIAERGDAEAALSAE